MTTKNQIKELSVSQKAIKFLYETIGLTPLQASQYDDDIIQLTKQLHYQYAYKNLHKSLSFGYQKIDSGQPWILFWILNIINMIDDKKFKNPIQGGFVGVRYCQSHVASTYAAISAIAVLGGEDAYSIVNRTKMGQFLYAMRGGQQLLHANIKSEAQLLAQKKNQVLEDQKQASHSKYPSHERMIAAAGSYHLHFNGEIDLRGIYCCLVIADLLNLLDDPKYFPQELKKSMTDYIVSCQSYQGGFSCQPYGEAHGGYTFCSLSSLILLKSTQLIDQNRLIEWLSNRQVSEFGGFNGRINKLVDGCYNHWQGDCFELFDIMQQGEGNWMGQWLYNQMGMQYYCLVCCQDSSGGLMDMPGSRSDMYHSNYSLSGFIGATYKSNYKELYVEQNSNLEEKDTLLLGNNKEFQLKRLHPIFNMPHDKVKQMKKWFRQKYPITK